MSNNSDSIDKEIAAITQQIDSLVIDFNRKTAELKQRLEQLKSDKSKKSTDKGIGISGISIDNNDSDSDRELRLGDTVEITNNYLYKRGTKGVVVKITKARVTLCDTNNILHSRSHNNVRRITYINLNV